MYKQYCVFNIFIKVIDYYSQKPLECGGRTRNRTGVSGFAIRCITTLPFGQIWSGKPDSNRRPRPWQGRALPTELFPLHIAVLRQAINLYYYELKLSFYKVLCWHPVGGSNPCRRRERAVS